MEICLNLQQNIDTVTVRNEIFKKYFENTDNVRMVHKDGMQCTLAG